MCDRCAELEAEILSLKAELHFPNETRIQKLQRLGLTACEAQMVLVLYAAKGRAFHYWMLAERTGITETTGNVRTFIRNIRRKLGSGVIVSKKKKKKGSATFGYQMSPSGMALIAEVLSA